MANQATQGQRVLKNSFLVLFALSLVVLSYLFLSFLFFIYSPASKNSEPVIIDIQKGQTLRSVIKTLYHDGLIKDENKFLVLSKIRRAGRRVKSGELLFYKNMTPLAVLDTIINAKAVTYSFTVPEGYNIYQIAEVLKEKNLIKDTKEFISVARDKELISELGLKADSVEGYLFPETYVVEKIRDPKTLVRIMFKQYRQMMNEKLINRAHDIGLTEHELVTLASIIEKETGHGPEREIISSVFHNRLKKKMRLQSDPTTIYGVWETFDGNLTRSCLQTYTPYNTYKIFGLPKGPIASPGRDSILAALYPAKSNYLFFVSRKDCTHIFSEDYKGHHRAVERFQKDPASRRGRSWRDIHSK
jgi:UPF0755 protein